MRFSKKNPAGELTSLPLPGEPDATSSASTAILTVGKLLFLVGVYFVIGKLSLAHTVMPSGIASALWPPAAIALCACLFWGIRMVPAVWLGATLVNGLDGLSFSAAAIIGIGNATEAVIATLLVRHFMGQPPYFHRCEQIYKFIGIAAASSVVSASVGISALTLAGYIPATDSALHWMTWWIGDTAGMIVIAPLFLNWSNKNSDQWTARRILEVVVFSSLLVATTHIAFGDVFGRWAIAFLPLPFVIWAAFRFSLIGVSCTAAVICAITVWDTVHGHGPFAWSGSDEVLLLLMFYIGIVESVGLTLGTLIFQRKVAEEHLLTERDQLELRVEDRTRALSRDIEQRKRIEQELLEQEHQLAEAQHIAKIGSWNWEVKSNRVTWSDELYRIFGLQKGEFGETYGAYTEYLHPEDRTMMQQIIEKSLASGEPFHCTHRIVLPDGAIKMLAARGFASRDLSGQVVRLFGTAQDVTELRLAESALREAEERYRLVVELSPNAVFIQRAGIIVYANRAMLTLARAATHEQIIGKSLFAFLQRRSHTTVREQIEHHAKGEKTPALEEKFVRLDGTVVDIEINSAPFPYQGENASLFIMRDITERKKSVEKMIYLAHYDALTGLPNRVFFYQQLEHALSLAGRFGHSLEVLFIDLDRFKNINDTLGHANGDLVLKETAVRLRSVLRDADTVARLSGDEFVVLVENVGETRRGGTVAQKILSVLTTQPLLRDTQPLTITSSIGISHFPSDGADAPALLKKADIAMYRAKEMGRNNYRYYSSEMDMGKIESRGLEEALSRALEEQQLMVHYQPKLDVASQKIVGMEALLRWQHPTLGAVMPDKFIMLAEENGLILPIGAWVMRTACLQAKLWQRSGMAHLKLAVKLSARQLSDDNLIPCMQKILEETALSPTCLELEITEKAIMSNPEKAIIVLNALNKIGVQVMIEDFGLGYSSLAHLKKFQIGAVKIDRCFVQGLPDDQEDIAITRAIIGIAHGLEYKVSAEGVETRQQFEFLRDYACDTVQGYLFGAPIAAAGFNDLLKAQAA